jgi:hypothetical protein
LLFCKAYAIVNTANHENKKKEQTHMTTVTTDATAEFEEAFHAISVATWNRPRSTSELRAFVRRHHDSLVDAAE